MVHRMLCATALLVVVAACSTPGQAPRQAQADLPPLPSVPPAEMFATAIDDVCFEALARNQFPHQRVAVVDFIETDSAAAKFRTYSHDTLYRARSVSSPVLVSIAPGEARCDVIAVAGDPAELRTIAEDAISRFDQRGLTDIADYLSAIDRSPKYALRFSLRYAGAVGDPDGMVEGATTGNNTGDSDDPFAITE